MNENQSAKFKFRYFISLLLAFLFLILAISGIVLFFAPTGRVANWTNWSFLGLGKEQYASLHILISLIIIIAVPIHLYYNWKIFVNALKKNKYIFTSKESIYAVASAVIIVLLGALIVFPASTLMNIQDSTQKYWAKNTTKPPYPHAELSTLMEFLKKIDVTQAKAVERMLERNIKFNNFNQTIQEIARNNDMSPAKLHQIVVSSESAPTEQKNGTISSEDSSLSIKEISQKFDIPLPKVLERLNDNKYYINSFNQTVAEVAAKYKVNSSLILNIITSKQPDNPYNQSLQMVINEKGLNPSRVVDILNKNKWHIRGLHITIEELSQKYNIAPQVILEAISK
ncbi:MAG: DUF4405 domain-containing protein [Bacteriovoracia bacterium]